MRVRVFAALITDQVVFVGAGLRGEKLYCECWRGQERVSSAMVNGEICHPNVLLETKSSRTSVFLILFSLVFALKSPYYLFIR
jgi:hypothetical protein